jgi:hypothetical protein
MEAHDKTRNKFILVFSLFLIINFISYTDIITSFSVIFHANVAELFGPDSVKSVTCLSSAVLPALPSSI